MREKMEIQLPKIESLLGVSDFTHEIQAYVTFNPTKDHIYYFPNKARAQGYRLAAASEGCVKIDIFEALRENTKQNAVVAGSAALWYLQKKVFGGGANWKADDTDIFFLNSRDNSRYSTGATDLVMAKEKTVEELLLNFDLGCCRVAFDFQMNVWVSVQALNAIFNHHYPMPKYLRNKNDFNSMLSRFRSTTEKYAAEDMMFDRFIKRIKKYSDRGYGATWVSTDVILPWVENRFHYAEWKESPPPSSEDRSKTNSNLLQQADQMLKSKYGFNPFAVNP